MSQSQDQICMNFHEAPALRDARVLTAIRRCRGVTVHGLGIVALSSFASTSHPAEPRPVAIPARRSSEIWRAGGDISHAKLLRNRKCDRPIET